MSSSSNSQAQSLSYRDAGVDIDAGDALVDRIKPLAKKTMREGVLAGIGGLAPYLRCPSATKSLYWCRVPTAWVPNSNWHSNGIAMTPLAKTWSR
jgi:hypothetical protein